MKKIDIENWDRKSQFELFTQYDSPHFNIVAEVDVSKLLAFCKAKGLSGYAAVVYLITRVGNGIDAFKMRIHGDSVVQYDVINPSFTVMNDRDLFSYCSLGYDVNAEEFIKAAEVKIEDAKSNPTLKNESDTDDYFYMSCIPWIRFTGLTHAMHFTPCDSVPRFSWGKYTREGGRVMMPLSVQVHHALVDGMHVGHFYQDIESLLSEPEQIFENS